MSDHFIPDRNPSTCPHRLTGQTVPASLSKPPRQDSPSLSRAVSHRPHHLTSTPRHSELCPFPADTPCSLTSRPVNPLPGIPSHSPRNRSHRERTSTPQTLRTHSPERWHSGAWHMLTRQLALALAWAVYLSRCPTRRQATRGEEAFIYYCLPHGVWLLMATDTP